MINNDDILIKNNTVLNKKASNYLNLYNNFNNILTP